MRKVNKTHSLLLFLQSKFKEGFRFKEQNSSIFQLSVTESRIPANPRALQQRNKPIGTAEETFQPVPTAGNFGAQIITGSGFPLSIGLENSMVNLTSYNKRQR